MQKTKLIICITAFLLLTSIFTVIPAFSSQPPVDTTTYTIGTISQLRNVDPALAYDTASGELIHNILEPLIWYGAGHVYLPAQASVKVNSSDYSDKSYGGMLPYLAKYMPLVEPNTGHPGSNWTFQIDTTKVFQDWLDPDGVTVHSGQTVTADDVVYAFQRMLLFDSFESASYLIGTPMFGSTGWFDGDPLFDADPDTTGLQPLNTTGAGERKASAAVQSHIVKTSTTNVTLYFELDFPAAGLAQILAQTWGCIEPKAFVIAHGCWNGTFYDGWSSDADPAIQVSNYPSSAASPLDTHTPHSKYASSSAEPAICGTGPYKLTYWDQAAQQWRADKFANYWGGWAGNHVNTIIETGVDPWPTRKMMFLQGEFDSCVVNTANMFDLLDPVPGPNQRYTPIPGINLFYGQTNLVNAAFLMNQNMSATGKFVPKVNGLPKPDLFSDIHVRRAFASAVNFSNFISGAYFGEAVHPASWWIDGFGTTLDYENKTLVAWEYNKALIISEFAAAGITSLDITLTYNSGNVGRQIYCEMLRDGLKDAMGAPFTINVLAEDWGTFLTDQHAGNLPCWNVGWMADFADPDNFARPYMHSQGTFSGSQNVDTDMGGVISTQVDTLLDYAISIPDGPLRNATYQQLQSIYHDRIWGVITVQSTGRSWMRDWVRNFEINQLYPGAYLYNRYKTAAGALKQIDLDVTSTITPVVSFPTVLVYKNAMRRGYMGGGIGNASAARQIYDLHVKRTDAVAGLVAAVIGLKRTNLTSSSAESFAYPNSTFVLLGPAPDPGITVRLIHYETGSSTTGILPAKATGVTWQMAARTDVITFDCQDTNPANNLQNDGTVVAYLTNVADINGDGIVDILDAITLAGVYGKQAGQAGYNADANLNLTPDPVSLKQIIDILDAITLANNFGKHNQP